MDFYNIPIGFGLALSANTAAMNRYAQLSESEKQTILNKPVCSAAILWWRSAEMYKMYLQKSTFLFCNYVHFMLAKNM